MLLICCDCESKVCTFEVFGSLKNRTKAIKNPFHTSSVLNALACRGLRTSFTVLCAVDNRCSVSFIEMNGDNWGNGWAYSPKCPNTLAIAAHIGLTCSNGYPRSNVCMQV